MDCQLNVNGRQHQPVGWFGWLDWLGWLVGLRDLNKNTSKLLNEITKTNIAKDSNDINSPLFNRIWGMDAFDV